VNWDLSSPNPPVGDLQPVSATVVAPLEKTLCISVRPEAPLLLVRSIYRRTTVEEFGRSARLYPVRGKPVLIRIEEFEEGLDLLETRASRYDVVVRICVDKSQVFEFREMVVIE